MSSTQNRSFLMPPPTKPVPLDVWIDDADRADVGRDAFFAGREGEFDAFRRGVRGLANRRVGGGTIVFQGAPGAGKTALMHECVEAVRRHSTAAAPWIAVQVGTRALEWPEAVLAAMGRELELELERLSGDAPRGVGDRLSDWLGALAEMGKNLSERGFGFGGAHLGPARRAPESPEYPAEEILRGASKPLSGAGIVVFVDEAQNIRGGHDGPAADLVQALHEGRTGLSLLPVFFGLGNTRKVLSDLGVSRLADERLVEMGRMSDAEVAESLNRAFDAYDLAPPGPGRDEWIDVLADEAMGWPQHLSRMAVAAGRVLATNGGDLGRDHLDAAVLAGRAAKVRYYEMLLERAPLAADVYRRLGEAARKVGREWLSRSEIGHIAESELNAAGMSPADFVNRSLRAGVLSGKPARPAGPNGPALPERYALPAPSLGDYLRGLPDEPRGRPTVTGT